jgi:hypothetical protein
MLTAAQSLIDSVITSPLVDSTGVLTESCDPSSTCNQDQWLFKGVYFEHLGYFLEEIVTLDKIDISLRRDLLKKYAPFVFINASSVWNVARGADGKIGNWWGGPADAKRQFSVETQGSGFAALTCALRVSKLLEKVEISFPSAPGPQIPIHIE